MGLTNLKKISQGKVRDLYEIDDKHLLMVASDRLSAFDTILNESVVQKGAYLTQLSLFWFKYLDNILPNHISHDIVLSDILPANDYHNQCSMVVCRAKVFPIEVIIRGYLFGSLYDLYKKSNDGVVFGDYLGENLELAQKFDEPVCTISTKAISGNHDINISKQECYNLIGIEETDYIIAHAIKLYSTAYIYARNKGIIIADTKFEFGIIDERIVLIDELITPDCSRLWPLNLDFTQCLDKQIVRNFLCNKLKWNKQPPIPNLPNSLLEQLTKNYKTVFMQITGRDSL